VEKIGQVWSVDAIIAFMIFLVAIIIFFVYSINYSGETEDTFKKLQYDGDIILKILFSEGHPDDWNSTNVVNIGVMSEGKINETKIERFYNLTQDNYSTTKNLFKTSYDYYFFLDENLTINSSEIEGIGRPGTNKNKIRSTNLIKITRFTIYKEKPITAYLYIWEPFILLTQACEIALADAGIDPETLPLEIFNALKTSCLKDLLEHIPSYTTENPKQPL